MLHEFDISILHMINGLAGRSYALDRIIMTITDNQLFKGAPLVACLWWVWFTKPDSKNGELRLLALTTLVGATLAAAGSRLVQNLLSERPRPIHDPALEIRMPFGVPDEVLRDYSSFPSDTAALSFALAMGIWMCSRPLGSLAFLWAALVASLPRVFAGLHYMSDIIAGAVFGVLCVLALAHSPWVMKSIRKVLGLEQALPGPFYALAFLATFQIATYFHALRVAGRSFASIVKSVLGS